METKKYQTICNNSSSFSRLELEQTLDALEKAKSNIISLVDGVLKSKPIEKPSKHQGGKETDYYHVHIAINDAEVIVEELGTLEAQAVSPEGNTTPEASYYASLLDRWLSYVESM